MIIDAARAKALADATGPLPPPLSAEDIADAETRLGFPLPPLLKALYQQIANGGFGPGYGLFPLLGSTPDQPSVVDGYLEGRGYPEWTWPASRLAFCDWGCAIASCVDCAREGAPVLTFESSGEPIAACFAETHATLASWLEDWLSGVDLRSLMFEDDPSRTRMGINPFTRQPTTLRVMKLRHRFKPT
jgi:SMI1/KNR4 family protein SUKH-1